jgi:transglycosylase-like protein with SLT domain
VDLVTLLMVCAVGARIHGASLCPTRAPAVGRVIFVEAARPSIAQSPTASSIGDQPNPPPAIRRWRPFIAEASSRFGVPELSIRAVMAAESAGETILDGRPITSAAGAMGRMQVMPATYAELRLRLELGADTYDPRDNILAGTEYLRAIRSIRLSGLFRRLQRRPGPFRGLFAAQRSPPGRDAALPLVDRSGRPRGHPR